MVLKLRKLKESMTIKWIRWNNTLRTRLVYGIAFLGITYSDPLFGKSFLFLGIELSGMNYSRCNENSFFKGAMVLNYFRVIANSLLLWHLIYQYLFLLGIINVFYTNILCCMETPK